MAGRYIELEKFSSIAL